jgi:hypothetical protein
MKVCVCVLPHGCLTTSRSPTGESEPAMIETFNLVRRCSLPLPGNRLPPHDGTPIHQTRPQSTDACEVEFACARSLLFDRCATWCANHIPAGTLVLKLFVNVAKLRNSMPACGHAGRRIPVHRCSLPSHGGSPARSGATRRPAPPRGQPAPSSVVALIALVPARVGGASTRREPAKARFANGPRPRLRASFAPESESKSTGAKCGLHRKGLSLTRSRRPSSCRRTFAFR